MATTPLRRDKLVSVSDPFLQFESWLAEAKGSDPLYAQDACLATGARDGTVSNRLISMDSFSRDGFVFYTSTTSRKAKELECNPHCAMTFYWTALRRQVRIEGVASLLQNENGSEEYFRKLSFDQQIALSVLVSRQSEVVEEQERDELERACEKLSADCQSRNEPVPKPPSWKGYLITPTRIEFHQAHGNYFSDRLVFSRPSAKDTWMLNRLAA